VSKGNNVDVIMQDSGSNIAEQLGARKSSRADRPVYTYAIPNKLSRESGISSVSLTELTAEEELMASKRSRNDAFKLASELTKTSLVMVDGKRMSMADGSADAAWNTMHPKVRQLVMRAYSQLHSVEDEDESSFLTSCQVDVG